MAILKMLKLTEEFLCVTKGIFSYLNINYEVLTGSSVVCSYNNTNIKIESTIDGLVLILKNNSEEFKTTLSGSITQQIHQAISKIKEFENV